MIITILAGTMMAYININQGIQISRPNSTYLVASANKYFPHPQTEDKTLPSNKLPHPNSTDKETSVKEEDAPHPPKEESNAITTPSSNIKTSWTVMGQHHANIQNFFAHDYALKTAQQENFLERLIDGKMPPPPQSNSTITCGCPWSCFESALLTRNEHFICSQRIDYFMRKYGLNETYACETSGQMTNGGPCPPECDPRLCGQFRDTIPELASEDPNYNMKDRADTLPPLAFQTKRHDDDGRVVMVTKVLWEKDIYLLKQMICSFAAAYNRHAFYDIVVFTTMPWTDQRVEELQAFALPSRLLVLNDSPPLEDQIETLTKEERTHLNERCNGTDGELGWHHHCHEPEYGAGRNIVPLGYAWQAEFRSFHIWNHPALANYRYMIWMDSDTMCTRDWTVDPIEMMVENNLVAMFVNIRGDNGGLEIKEKMAAVYNRTICSVKISSELGHFITTPCDDKEKPSIPLIHGMHHITDLNFYRRTINQKYLALQVQKRFSRFWDDQLAVTLVPAMAAPNRTWLGLKRGYDPDLHHNGKVNGGGKRSIYLYNRWFNANKRNWTAGRVMCDGFMTEGGR